MIAKIPHDLRKNLSL